MHNCYNVIEKIYSKKDLRQNKFGKQSLVFPLTPTNAGLLLYWENWAGKSHAKMDKKMWLFWQTVLQQEEPYRHWFCLLEKAFNQYRKDNLRYNEQCME